jgi:NAD+ diphosphatase
VPEPNAFAGAGLDRAGPRRSDPQWVAAALADPDARAVVATPEGVAVDPAEPGRLLRAPAHAPGIDSILLGMEHGHPLFARALRNGKPGGGAILLNLREFAPEADVPEAGIAAYATAMLTWHAHHGHCARCGAPTRVVDAGHARRCDACGAMHHPRTDPVVIMLVLDPERDRVLLGRQASWPAGRFSALAGFVEPGETLEEAVAREVAEEAGVRVRDARYASSQPWPFPASLMLGFTATYDGGDPEARDGELEAVRWLSRAEVEAAARDEGEILLPPRLAIARRLLDGWLAGDLPG